MWQGDQWRDGADPSDLLFALDSQYSYYDFQGRAAFYEDAKATSPLPMDLFITAIDANLEEYIQSAPHVADSFGIVCFGKAPMRLNISARLADTQLTHGKQYLIDAYKNKLRLGACARTGKIPVLVCGSYAWQGPLVSMRLTESSQSEDTLVATLEMIVTGMQVTGQEGGLYFDFVHGSEEPAGLNLAEKEQVADAESKVVEEKLTNTAKAEPSTAQAEAAPAPAAKPPHASPTPTAQAQAGATPDYAAASRKTAMSSIG